MRKGTHLVSAFARAMDEGRLADAMAILGECRMESLRDIILDHYYVSDTVRHDTASAILERFAGW